MCLAWIEHCSSSPFHSSDSIDAFSPLSLNLFLVCGVNFIFSIEHVTFRFRSWIQMPLPIPMYMYNIRGASGGFTNLYTNRKSDAFWFDTNWIRIKFKVVFIEFHESMNMNVLEWDWEPLEYFFHYFVQCKINWFFDVGFIRLSSILWCMDIGYSVEVKHVT